MHFLRRITLNRWRLYSKERAETEEAEDAEEYTEMASCMAGRCLKQCSQNQDATMSFVSPPDSPVTPR